MRALRRAAPSQGEKIRKVVRVLDLTKSTYYPAFNRLCKEAAAACTEANDNVRPPTSCPASAPAPDESLLPFRCRSLPPAPAADRAPAPPHPAPPRPQVKYLETLKVVFEKMTANQDFAQLTESFRPIVHLIMLVWKHSKHYNTPARLVVLMREICNELIRQVRGTAATRTPATRTADEHS